MEVRLARTAGFCMGVTRAMNMATRAAEENAPGPIVTFGPLIHNRQAVESLEERGIEVAEDIDSIEAGTVIIRAHGVTKDIKDRLISRGVNVIDASCPNVLVNQRRIAEWTAKGYALIVVGDLSHAEITGLLGHVESPDGLPAPGAGFPQVPAVVSSAADVAGLELPDKVVVVAQTTFSQSKYAAIIEAVKLRRPDAQVFASICSSTEDRQDEVAELAAETDAVVVVGARHSANTLRLAEISREMGVPTFHVESSDELNESDFAEVKVVGVTAGASTPSEVTEEVAKRLREMGS